MNQRFEEDKAEIDAHFAERVRAYVELGETPEQAALSAREKFGETETVVRELRWQRVLRHPAAISALSGTLWLAMYLPLALPARATFFSWLSARQQFVTEPMPSMALGWYAIMETALIVVPTSLGAAFLGRRFPNRRRAILGGTMVFAVFGVSTRDPITLLIFALLALLGASCGLWSVRRKSVSAKRRARRV